MISVIDNNYKTNYLCFYYLKISPLYLHMSSLTVRQRAPRMSFRHYVADVAGKEVVAKENGRGRRKRRCICMEILKKAKQTRDRRRQKTRICANVGICDEGLTRSHPCSIKVIKSSRYERFKA